ncbi:MAG: thermonuclease family protein [Candidatus Omnitrophota bacterium]|nr:MAG: thermonuclease family protein [Candidatus Omnitrophota bacterium]
MKKYFSFLLFFLLVSCAPSDYSNIKVDEVIDGDTIKLSNGKLLRYIGIDTPEMRTKRGNQFIYSPQPYSLEAKEFNRNLVEGKFVRIEFDVEKHDRYKRLLGYCFAGEEFVNAKMITEGMAVIYTKPPNVKYADLFVDLQKQARKARKGLWGAYKIIDQSRAHKYINQIRTVRGKVLNTYDSGKVVFLNFGEDYKTDFTVIIFRNSLPHFKRKGIDPVTFYNAKTIEVSGRIREFNGPEIIVNSPEEIEIIGE